MWTTSNPFPQRSEHVPVRGGRGMGLEGLKPEV